MPEPAIEDPKGRTNEGQEPNLIAYLDNTLLNHTTIQSRALRIAKAFDKRRVAHPRRKCRAGNPRRRHF